MVWQCIQSEAVFKYIVIIYSLYYLHVSVGSYPWQRLYISLGSAILVMKVSYAHIQRSWRDTSSVKLGYKTTTQQLTSRENVAFILVRIQSTVVHIVLHGIKLGQYHLARQSKGV